MESNVQGAIAWFCLVFRAFSQINLTTSWPTVPDPPKFCFVNDGFSLTLFIGQYCRRDLLLNHHIALCGILPEQLYHKYLYIGELLRNTKYVPILLFQTILTKDKTLLTLSSWWLPSSSLSNCRWGDGLLVVPCDDHRDWSNQSIPFLHPHLLSSFIIILSMILLWYFNLTNQFSSIFF